MNWPSAPIFHTLARKPTARPVAISANGVALRNNSATPYWSAIGFKKKTLKPSKGSRPSSRKTAKPPTIIRPIAINGDAKRIAAAGSGRASSSSHMARLRGACRTRPHAAHPDADLLDVGVRRKLDWRQATLRNHRDAIADLEQFVELLRNNQHRRAAVAQVDQRLADERGRADVHPPRGLRHDQQLGLLQDLAPHDELLQIAAR